MQIKSCTQRVNQWPATGPSCYTRSSKTHGVYHTTQHRSILSSYLLKVIYVGERKYVQAKPFLCCLLFQMLLQLNVNTVDLRSWVKLTRSVKINGNIKVSYSSMLFCLTFAAGSAMNCTTAWWAGIVFVRDFKLRKVGIWRISLQLSPREQVTLCVIHGSTGMFSCCPKMDDCLQQWPPGRLTMSVWQHLLDSPSQAKPILKH